MASISTTLPDNSENIEINMAYLINHITKVAVNLIIYKKYYALTTILPILFMYLNTVMVTAGTFEP
jgi:hypothetical protein